jgi:hypothetical protein
VTTTLWGAVIFISKYFERIEMFKATEEGSTGRLIQLCIGYFLFYVIYSVNVKYFTDVSAGAISLKLNQMQYMVYSTIGGMLIALLIVMIKRWYKLKSNKLIPLGIISLPYEVKYIIPSGIMTAIIIPTTTLMYTFGMSVMVAMVIMRASIIIISRLVDSVQIKQRILHKKVYKEENIAVVFALVAMGVNLFWVKAGDFDLLNNTVAVGVLSIYIIAYAIRIYIMNYFKNTRAKGVPLDNSGFFGIEQISAATFALLLGVILYNSTDWFGWNVVQISSDRDAFTTADPNWGWAVLSGTAYGIVAFFSVFLFMFKGRTATFAGLVNRLTSLIAGTTATLITFFLFGGKFPKAQDWLSLVFILIAVAYLSIAERKRMQEIKSEIGKQ